MSCPYRGARGSCCPQRVRSPRQHQGPARVAIEVQVVLEDLSPILEARARREGQPRGPDGDELDAVEAGGP